MNHQGTKTPKTALYGLVAAHGIRRMGAAVVEHKADDIGAGIDHIATAIVDSAFAIHKALGPGLLEQVYEACLAHELAKRGLRVERQVDLPVVYDGIRFEVGFRLDLIVEESVIVELKAVEKILPIHHAQVLTYLKMTNKRLGLLINFNTALIKDGIKRIAL